MEETARPIARSPEPAEAFTECPGGRIHTLDWGGGGLEAHFLHGNGFCAGTYAPFIRHLLPGLRVIASDIRGHGDSDPPDIETVTHWRVFAEDLCCLIEARLRPPVVGMGHSLGAVATLIAAAARPRLFSALVLLDPVILPRRFLWALGLLKRTGAIRHFPLVKRARRRRRRFQSRRSAFRLYAAGRGIFKSWSEEFLEAYLECGLLEKDPETAVLKCDPELEARIFESVPLDIWRTVRRIGCPVLAIRGERSDTFLPDAARRLARLLPGLELVTLPRSGHFVPMEQPEACSDAIRGFLSRRIGAAVIGPAPPAEPRKPAAGPEGA